MLLLSFENGCGTRRL